MFAFEICIHKTHPMLHFGLQTIGQLEIESSQLPLKTSNVLRQFSNRVIIIIINLLV